MPLIDTTHQFTPACAAMPKRHVHDYKPPTGIPSRCRCGHTRFTVNTGGFAGPLVSCAKCTNTNTYATAYENGVAAGVAWATRKAAAPL